MVDTHPDDLTTLNLKLYTFVSSSSSNVVGEVKKLKQFVFSLFIVS